MEKYYRDILIDHRTSCTRDEAAAIVLGIRTFDPIYPDSNSGADPDAVNEAFMEWLTTPLIEDLKNDRDIRVREMEDALGDQPEGTPSKNEELSDGWQASILVIDEAIRRAKQILCDIDDELAKGSESKLRIDKDATAKFKTPCITRNSLRDWTDGKEKQVVKIGGSLQQSAPPANPALPSEPLLDKKGGMTPAMAKSFLATFGLLLEAFLERPGSKFESASGTEVSLAAVAKHLSERSILFARKDHYLVKQSVSAIEERIKAARANPLIEVPEDQVIEIFEASTAALSKARANPLKPK